ncbi:hypothetical protein B0H13DRAFT_270744 [Mycena leptocephala]|nr:hypothetical protein B0H13DRAFT_270744 [Mycena leptocephala]
MQPVLALESRRGLWMFGDLFHPVSASDDAVHFKLAFEESQETVFLAMHARLFRLDRDTEEWMEQGKGIVRLLVHRETQKMRFVMREDDTQTICCNFFVTPNIWLQPADERSWLWNAPDVSESPPVTKTFSIRLSTSDDAAKFKHAFDMAPIN